MPVAATKIVFLQPQRPDRRRPEQRVVSSDRRAYIICYVYSINIFSFLVFLKAHDHHSDRHARDGDGHPRCNLHDPHVG